MADIVLVPGSWHGGWYFSPIQAIFRVIRNLALVGTGSTMKYQATDQKSSGPTSASAIASRKRPLNRASVPALRDVGHKVFAVTPTGVGDLRHLTSGAINLDTHIQDVVNTFEIEGIDDAVLVGHSYGGNVITGVSSRLTRRIRSLVYLDALLPQDGQSAWT